MSAAPYAWRWERSQQSSLLVWRVTALAEDGRTPRRTLEYALGEWREEHAGGGSPPFDEAGTVTRHTTWETCEDALGGMAHVTSTSAATGSERVARYLVDPGGGVPVQMACRRRFSLGGEATAESLEIFDRV